MSRRRIGGAGLIYGGAAGIVLIVALGLIGLGLVRMTSSSEAVPFRSVCQGDDACRQTLVERLPGLQAAPGGVAAWVHDALTRSAPALASDATLAACQAAGAPEACTLDPAKLKPGEAGALVAIFDAHSLTTGRQSRACPHLDACATRALAALGAYGFDPARLQGALQRTSYPLPLALKACADAPSDGLRSTCGAEALLKAAPEPLTVALEQDWRSGGAEARLPQPSDPQAQLLKNALWAGLGAALGMLAVGLVWAGVSLGKTGLTKRAQGGSLAAEGAAMTAQRAPLDADPPPAPQSAVRRAAAASPGAARPASALRGAPAATVTPPREPAAPLASMDAPAIGPTARPRARVDADRSKASSAPYRPPPEVAAFQTALSIPGSPETFARLAFEEGGRLSPRFDEGERLAAGAILAAHRLRGDRPADSHAGAYDDLVLGLAGSGHRLVWPRPGAPITADMDTCETGELYAHAVEAVVRPGLIDGSGALVLRPRVRAR